MEKFNPYDQAYKKVSDLPVDEQDNFKDIEGGFIKKTFLENIDEVRSDEEFLMRMPENTEINNNKINEFELLLGEKEVKEIREIVKDLENPIRNLLKQILENIKSDKYQLLIGDDASGRIPTLIIYKFINATKHNESKIITRFVAGSRYGMRDNRYIGNSYKTKLIEKYLNDIKNSVSIPITNALIVTEYISQNMSLYPLKTALEKNDIKTDTLSVYVANSSVLDGEERIKDFLERDIYTGELISGGYPKIYGQQFSGIRKKNNDLHATPIGSTPTIDAMKTIARDEANKVADKLIAELLEQK